MPPFAGRHHTDACLRCQAQSARRRRLWRDLHQLATVSEPAPPGLSAAVMSALDVAPVTVLHRSRTGRRAATAGALLGAAVAAAGAAAVAVRRGRPAVG